MTPPTHPLVKALLDLTLAIARHNAHPQRPAIFPKPAAILAAAEQVREQQERTS